LRLNSGLAAFARLTESVIHGARRLTPPVVGGCIVLFAAVDAKINYLQRICYNSLLLVNTLVTNSEKRS
jgi:hypothetical protein